MADISQIKLPDNNTYNFKDTVARGVKMYYGTCTTAAATAAKVVTVSADQDFKLTVGALVMVKFSASNSASSVTLNVNSTGAKSIYYNNAVYTGTSTTVCGYANAHFIYMYDGTNWVWIGHGSDSNTTYSAMSVSEGQTATATSARSMRSDYLKQIIQYHAVPSGQGVPAGGTAGQVLAKVDGTDYNTEWIDAPSGVDEMIYYQAPRTNPPTPKPSEFVYPGDVDLEFYLDVQAWSSVSSDMRALFPSVDLYPTYHYKQKKMTNSSGTYLYRTARWETRAQNYYINFAKIAGDSWRVRDMNVKIGAITNTTFAITSDTQLANAIKAIYACRITAGYGVLKGFLEVKSGSTYMDIIPVTGIVKSATTFEFETYIRNSSTNKMYLIHASFSSGTWTVISTEVGTLA